jgi:Flp pilus assembly protein TadB
MRKDFPDPEEYLDKHMEGVAKRYADGLQRGGLKRNPKLDRAVFEREFDNAHQRYVKEITNIRDENIQAILQNHQREMKKIRREGADWGLKVFPIVTLIFGLTAWYAFGHGDPGMWIIYVVGALFFFALTLAALVNKWQ